MTEKTFFQKNYLVLVLQSYSPQTVSFASRLSLASALLNFTSSQFTLQSPYTGCFDQEFPPFLLPTSYPSHSVAYTCMQSDRLFGRRLHKVMRMNYNTITHPSQQKLP